MKKSIVVLYIVLSSISVGLAVSAQQPDQSSEKAGKVYSGEVQSVDQAKKEIVIKGDTGADVRLLVSAATKITKEGKPISIAEVKAGEMVSVECEESKDGCMAKSIQIAATKKSQ
jgi:hypothetical protein